MHGKNVARTSTLFDHEAHGRVLRTHLFLFWLLDRRRGRVLGIVQRGACHGDDAVVGGAIGDATSLQQGRGLGRGKGNEFTNGTRLGRREDKCADRVTDGGGLERIHMVQSKRGNLGAWKNTRSMVGWRVATSFRRLVWELQL